MEPMFGMPHHYLMNSTIPVPPPGTASAAAIRRLKRDLEKIVQEPIDGVFALPSEENILEWHYVLKGSPETVYEGGYYYGKLIFQPDFPWKPPSIYMITPNGRFRTNMRLCLSISDYHPESWNPGWTVSAILVGLHSFMNEAGHAAGTINDTPQMCRHLAADSIRYNLLIPDFCNIFPHVVEEIQIKTGALPSTTSASSSIQGNATQEQELAPPAKKNRIEPESTRTAPVTGQRVVKKNNEHDVVVID